MFRDFQFRTNENVFFFERLIKTTIKFFDFRLQTTMLKKNLCARNIDDNYYTLKSLEYRQRELRLKIFSKKLANRYKNNFFE